MKYPHHLTGISDENNDRFATWAYNAEGKAILSEHAGGAERVIFDYHNDGSTTVTGALGDTRTYRFEIVQGGKKVKEITGDRCVTCGQGGKQYRSYDSNGFLSSYTDWNGTQTTLIHNARGQIESRTDAVGTTEERTTVTQWHNHFNLPIRITEPNKITELIYNATGQLLKKTLTDTFTGESQTIHYSYHLQGTHGAGLIASMEGARTDVDDITTYNYDAQNNLIQITNALGHTLDILAYDPSGRPLLLRDANGIMTQRQYHPRGWLASQQIGDQLTLFDYDKVGQLIKMTLPDQSEIYYFYDPAHRLIAIQDAQGNQIDYTLDAMGHIIEQQIKDANGLLITKQHATYNVLGQIIQRLQAQGQTTTYNYDNNGNQLTLNTPNGNQNQYQSL